MTINNSLEQCFMNHVSEKSNLEYQVLQASQSKMGIKTRIAVLKDAVPIYSDSPNVSSAKSRAQFVNKLSERQNVNKADIEQDLMEIERLCQQKFTEGASVKSKEQSLPEITEEDRQRALDFLKNPGLMNCIQNDIRDVGLVGEEINSQVIYLAGTSRITDFPISVVVKGGSSSGKSVLANRVINLMPEESRKEYSSMSAKALGYKQENDLKHKILVVYEHPGAEASDYQLRTMQSEQKVRILVTVKDPETGEFKTQEREVCGPIAYIETTTNTAIHPENETRMFSLYMDESEEQTRRIQERQKLRYRLENVTSESRQASIVQLHHTIQRLLKPYRVHIPYVNLIGFSSQRLRSRRDFPRFLSVIECIVLLHQFQRELVTFEGQEFLKATVQDYKCAYELAQNLLSGGLEVPPKSREILRICEEIKGKGQDITTGQLVKCSKWSRTEVKKYIEPLVENGFLDIITGGQGKEYRYQLLKSFSLDNFLGIVTPDELSAQYVTDEEMDIDIGEFKTVDEMIGDS